MEDIANWEVLQDIENDLHGECIFCGDFNGRSKFSGSNVENRQGMALEIFLAGSDLTCINDGVPTRLATSRGDTDSVIDLALISPQLNSDNTPAQL